MPGNNNYDFWTINGSPSNNRYNVPWWTQQSANYNQQYPTDYKQNYYDMNFAPGWFQSQFGGKQLGNWDISLNKNLANQSLINKEHSDAYDLNTAWQKNYQYINTPDVVGQDIQSFYNTTNGITSGEDFVNYYNTNAQKIRDFWSKPRNYQNYNSSEVGNFNRLYRSMFSNRSNVGSNFNSGYDIGYDPNIEGRLGSSTWLRRMDLYENEFDPINPDQDRIHEVKLSNGKIIKVYKKANGDIGLFNDISTSEPVTTQSVQPNLNGQPVQTAQSPTRSNPEIKIEGKVETSDTSMNPEKISVTGGGSITPNKKSDPWWKTINWKGLGENIQNLAPNIMEDVRLAGTLNNNNRVYEATLKGIRPNLMQTYLTHRQVVGDEATKQAYYRRGVEGTTRASQAFTSDADRQMAYQMEAQRQANELRAQGDLADNQEIRRTSDESNQHQWANTQRRTEVANQNIAQINAANQAKQNLLAQKYTADWTSWDNFLRGREYRWRQKQAENKALDDQMWMLQRSNEIENDPILLDLQSQLEAVSKLPENQKKEYGVTTINYNAPAIKELQRKIRNRQFQLQYETLQQKQARKISFVKSGNKITYKKKDDLLYKSARDAVEHFRKMTKLTDDSYQKSRKKIPKLTPHPKGSVKKYQQGGVGPFGVFTPVGLGGEQSMTTESTAGSSSRTSSNKDDSGKDMLNLFKDLFSKMEGLPIDVSSIYAPLMSLMDRVKFNGGELSPQEISTIYIQSMQQLSKLKYNQKQYDNAVNNAKENEALTEFVITPGGKILSQNINDGSFKPMSWEELSNSDEYRALTNNTLLELRANSPNLAFNSQILEYVNGTVGMNKVTEQIKNLIGTMGETEIQKQGYTKKEASQIAKGLEMLADAPDGVYEYTIHNKNQDEQVKAAFRFIKNTLPRNMRDTLKVYADMGGVSIDNIIKDALGKGYKSTNEFNIEAMTGKAAKDADGNSKDNSDGLKLDAATALISGKGYKSEIELNPGSSYSVKTQGRFSEFQKHSGENMGAGITMQEATTSTLHGVLDWNKATLGGSRIISNAYNKVIINNGEVVGIDLPVDSSNPDVPDFDRLDQLKKLDEQLRLNNIEDTEQNWEKVNELCDGIGIPHKYVSSGKLNVSSWKRFAAFQATAPDTTLVDKNVILDILGIANNNERELYNSVIQHQDPSNKNFELSNKTLGIFGTKEELYKGTVFVPIKESYVGAALSGNQTIKMTEATNLELKEQGYDPTKINTYKKPEYTL